MKTKLIIVFLLAAAAAGVVRTASIIQKKPAPHKDYLKWSANEAKNKGQQKVRVAAPLIEYLGGAGGISAEEVLRNDKLAPVSESEHKIRKDFKDVYGNSLDQLRKHLKNGTEKIIGGPSNAK
jgi:hypothetical protein